MQIQMLDEAKNLLRKNELNNDMDIQIENVKLAILNNVKLLYWQAEKTLLKLQYESGYILREL